MTLQVKRRKITGLCQKPWTRQPGTPVRRHADTLGAFPAALETIWVLATTYFLSPPISPADVFTTVLISACRAVQSVCFAQQIPPGL